MWEDFGLTVEAVMAMPFCRFMALTQLRQRHEIEARNRARRQQWEAENRGS